MKPSLPTYSLSYQFITSETTCKDPRVLPTLIRKNSRESQQKFIEIHYFHEMSISIREEVDRGRLGAELREAGDER